MNIERLSMIEGVIVIKVDEIVSKVEEILEL
jgi:hypothetical protein